MTSTLRLLIILGLHLAAPAFGAPLGVDSNREELAQLVHRLHRLPVFKGILAAGGEVSEVARFDVGLFVRYKVDRSGKECLGKLVTNAVDGVDQFVPDETCAARVQPMQSERPRLQVQVGEATVGDLFVIAAAVRFLNRTQQFMPPVGKPIAARRDRDRMVVTYYPVSGSSPCTVTLAIPAHVQMNEGIWTVLIPPACETQ